jgi:hypothetical protein
MIMSSIVYYGSPRQSRLEASETLPCKLDLILEKLHLRDRVKGETVVLKMHTGNNVGYSTLHPVFVRRVVQAIKDGGGKPFVADVDWDVEASEQRGYTTETLGCPICLSWQMWTGTWKLRNSAAIRPKPWAAPSIPPVDWTTVTSTSTSIPSRAFSPGRWRA